jgi:LysM repeat protein
MPSPRATLSGARRTLTVSAVTTVAGALLTTMLAAPAGGTPTAAVRTLSAPSVAPSLAPAARREDTGKRRIVRHRVKPGDTATELAVRYHAWTSELIAMNGLGSSGQMYVGQLIKVPVVVYSDGAAPRKKQATRKKQSTRKAGKQKATGPKAKPRRKARTKATTCRSCLSSEPQRQQVRRVITRTARRHGVDPQLALAISWQESGWRMSPVSSVGAIGAMQVLPTTGVWMSMYAGRALSLRTLRDNATAGVLMLKVLRSMPSIDTQQEQIAAYYQGPGAVQDHGIYPVSRPYVANVLAIKQALERGQQPG